MSESAPVSSASVSNLPTFSDNSGVDAEAQSRAAELVQKAMYFYWHGGDPQQFEQQLFKGITLKGRFDIVEQCFRDALRPPSSVIRPQSSVFGGGGGGFGSGSASGAKASA